MKRKLIRALTICMVGLYGVMTFGGTIPKVYLNNNKLMAQHSPFQEGDTYYIPVRLVENLGFNVKWDNKEGRTVLTQGDEEYALKAGSKEFLANGGIVTLDKPIKSKNGAIYVPIEVIKVMGAVVAIKENDVYLTYDLPTDGSYQYDNFGRIIRKDNLPKNADQYLYIAEGVPNEMYELPLEYETVNFFKEGRHYTRPVNMPTKTQKFRDETVKQWRGQFEEYLDLVLNFDYRNVPKDYAKKVASCYSQNYITGNTKVVEDFIQYAKDKHLIIEGDYYVEPSTTHVLMGAYSQRAWVRFIIKSDIADKGQMVQDVDSELKTNVWYEGYVDLNLSSNDNGSDGTDMVIHYKNITTSTMLKEVK